MTDRLVTMQNSYENIAYNGPEVGYQPKDRHRETPIALEPLWREFTDGYGRGQWRPPLSSDAAALRPRTGNSEKPGLHFSPSRAEATRLLDAIAFGKGGARSFLRERGLDTLDTDAKKEQFTHIRNLVEDACHINSRITSNKVLGEQDSKQKTNRYRPLNRAIMNKLIEQWIALEREHGMYPPQRSVDKEGKRLGKTRVDLAEKEQKRIALLATPEGALLSGMLKMLTQAAVRAETEIIYKNVSNSGHMNLRVSIDEAHSEAANLFRTSLFYYEMNENSREFSTFVHQLIARDLPKRLWRLHNNRCRATGLHGKDDQVGGLLAMLADTTAPNGEKLTRTAEMRDRVHLAMEMLTDEQREIISRRFGLPPFNTAQTLADISKEMNLPLSAVKDYISKAVDALHEELADKRSPDMPVAPSVPIGELSLSRQIGQYREIMLTGAGNPVSREEFAKRIRVNMNGVDPIESTQLNDMPDDFIRMIESGQHTPSRSLMNAIIAVLSNAGVMDRRNEIALRDAWKIQFSRDCPDSLAASR